ncbi:DUF4211 domain-containing protein [Nephila pilipes]|uniref:DUF4211 domain-containing protein n=1 Tax=Nephila pilipes TaxID=299642 RepID=A0A8X6TY24_NEPPI|nr:DUF4211 domain-containing protein [Nephila pilipes]
MTSQWMQHDPHTQFNPTYLRSGSLHPPPPIVLEDHLNNYGGGNSNSLHLSSCSSRQVFSTRTNPDPSVTSLLANTTYQTSISPKEASECNFNVSKDNDPEIHGYAQMSGSLPRNERNNFHSSENGNYVVSYQPSPGPFGVLPHESVMNQRGRYERKNESFISPSPKTNTASYNNGPYADNTNVYSSAPLSAQSAYSGDTTSQSPPVADSTTSSFSPSSDVHENVRAYSGRHNPLPQSPVTVTKSTFSSSPNTNSIVSESSMSKNIVTFMNDLNCVPTGNGQNTDHNPSIGTASNGICFKTPQSQNLTHHGPQSMLPKSDYNSEYHVYAPDQNSGVPFNSSYCPPIHQAQLSNGTNTRHLPRGHAYNNSVQHEGMHYGHVALPSATISSPNYLPSKVSHETPYGSCSSNIPPGQSMRPADFIPKGINSQSNLLGPMFSSMMENQMMVENHMSYHSIDDDKGTLNFFNNIVDSGVDDQEVINHMSHYMDDSFLPSETTTNRQLRSKVNDYSSNHSPNIRNSNKNMNHQPKPIHHSHEHLNGGYLNFNPKYYNPPLDPDYPRNLNNNVKKRGRRGRRRKAEVNGSRGRSNATGRKEYNGEYNDFNNGASLSAGNNHTINAGYYKNPSQKFVNENVLPPPSSSNSLFQPKSDPKPFVSLDENEYNGNCNCGGKKNNDNKKRTDYGPYNTKHVLREILPFINHTAPIRRKTRNTEKRESLYQVSYVNFVRERRVLPGAQWPPNDQEAEVRKEKPVKYPKIKRDPDLDPLKLKIKMDPHKPDKWYCCRGSYDYPVNISDDSSEGSASSSSEVPMFSNRKIKKEISSDDENSNFIGNVYKVTEKTSAKGKSNDKSNDFKETHLNYLNNSETLPAGKTNVEKLPVLFNSDEQLNLPKKSGRKTKISSETNTKTKKTSLKSTETRSNSSMFIKKEIIEEGAAPSERLRSLRSRRNESMSKESEPGPSVQEEEPPDFSSDHYENFDDTDSDPAWTPSSKSSKAVENAKTFVGQFPKKRGPKAGRRGSVSNNLASKRKRANQQDPPSKKKCPAKPETQAVKKKVSANSKVKKDTESDRFLVAKADINLPTPFIWKVDKKSSMLQRFEISEQNGVLLYHSSFTYAARNEISVNNYVTADVRIKSPDTVQYLGPNLTEAAAVALSKMKPAEPLNKTPVKQNFDHLKEDFTVYLQCLLSQDVDSNFLYEIYKFSDDYFLVPITNLETVSENKKQKLIKDSWDEDLRKCVNNFPCISVENNTSEIAHCHVCDINLGNKLLQFYGQPYDLLTLAPVDTLLANKTQFDVCDKCSSSLSLYNRVHHHKYNLFIKCRSKASEVKSNHDNLKSHEDVLKLCLEDITWIDQLFGEQTQMWHEVEEKS